MLQKISVSNKLLFLLSIRQRILKYVTVSTKILGSSVFNWFPEQQISILE